MAGVIIIDDISSRIHNELSRTFVLPNIFSVKSHAHYVACVLYVT